MSTQYVYFPVLMILIFLFSCASYLAPRPALDYYPGEEAPAPLEMMKTMDEKKATDMSLSENETAEGRKEDAAPVPETDERLRIYFGSLKLRVGSVEEVRSRISEKVDRADGYVESIYENYIIIRIPKEYFTGVFNEIMQLGEVIHKSVETSDVSDKFQDLVKRLDIAQMARNRLYTLLENTADVEQRLKILKEIRRLTEEIEMINLKLESLKRLIAFSRITVELTPRLADSAYIDKSNIPFPWLSKLDPFYTSLPNLSAQIRITLGDDFAVFNQSTYFLAETADSIRIRIGSTPNFPRGDALFWQEAIVYHLAKYYQTTLRLDAGEIKGVLFTSKDQSPFYYFAGVAVKDKDIHVVEIFFPDQNKYENKIEALKMSLQNLRID